MTGVVEADERNPDVANAALRQHRAWTAVDASERIRSLVYPLRDRPIASAGRHLCVKCIVMVLMSVL